jgi:hypothetical protein
MTGEKDLRKEILALRAANVALHDRAEAAESWFPDNDLGHRVCVNCGKKIPKGTKYGESVKGCKSPDACTFDMSYMELVARCKTLENANQVLQKDIEDWESSQQESNTKQ